jgi:hypothetical protein
MNANQRLGKIGMIICPISSFWQGWERVDCHVAHEKSHSLASSKIIQSQFFSVEQVIAHFSPTKAIPHLKQLLTPTTTESTSKSRENEFHKPKQSPLQNLTRNISQYA